MKEAVTKVIDTLTHRALSGAIIPGQSGPGIDANKGVLRIPQSPALLGPHHLIV